MSYDSNIQNNESKLVARLNGKIANLKHREKQLKDNLKHSETMLSNIMEEHELQKSKLNNNNKDLKLKIDRLKIKIIE
jgi:hypothetical protein